VVLLTLLSYGFVVTTSMMIASLGHRRAVYPTQVQPKGIVPAFNTKLKRIHTDFRLGRGRRSKTNIPVCWRKPSHMVLNHSFKCGPPPPRRQSELTLHGPANAERRSPIVPAKTPLPNYRDAIMAVWQSGDRHALSAA